MSKEFASIVFVQGEEGREVTDALFNVEGVVQHGATDESVAEAIRYLSDWEHEDLMEWSETAPWGSQDDTWEQDGYVLAANSGLGYASLQLVRNR